MTSIEPTKIEYHSDGSIKNKQWGFKKTLQMSASNVFLLLHRAGSPALQSFATTGRLVREEYWFNGVTHREDGPAVISYTTRGTIRKAEWFYRGKYVDKIVKDWFKENKVHTWTKASKATKMLFKLQVIEQLRKDHKARI